MPWAGRWWTAKITPSPWPSGTTCARDCIRGRCSVSTNSPPVKSSPGRDNSTASCSGNTCGAVEILVQRVEVARRRTAAAAASDGVCPAAWHRARNSACVGREVRIEAQCGRATGWRSARAADTAALRRRRDQLGQRIGEVPVLTAAEAVAGHHDVAAKGVRRRDSGRRCRGIPPPTAAPGTPPSRVRRGALRCPARRRHRDEPRIPSSVGVAVDSGHGLTMPWPRRAGHSAACGRTARAPVDWSFRARCRDAVLNPGGDPRIRHQPLVGHRVCEAVEPLADALLDATERHHVRHDQHAPARRRPAPATLLAQLRVAASRIAGPASSRTVMYSTRQRRRAPAPLGQHRHVFEPAAVVVVGHRSVGDQDDRLAVGAVLIAWRGRRQSAPMSG